MGPVETAVRAHVFAGAELRTPGLGKPFIVQKVEDRGIVLLIGAGGWTTPIPWPALEGVADVLRGRGWVRTTGSFEPEKDTTTLSGHLKQFVNRETANWVAVVLSEADVLELDRRRPVRARLRPGF